MTFDEEVYEYAKSRNGTEDSRMTDRMLAYRAGARSREERIKELEKSNENLANQSMILCQRNAEFEMLVQKLKCCENCKHYKPAVTVNETIGNMCEDFENGCNNSEISPYNKWELSD